MQLFWFAEWFMPNTVLRGFLRVRALFLCNRILESFVLVQGKQWGDETAKRIPEGRAVDITAPIKVLEDS